MKKIRTAIVAATLVIGGVATTGTASAAYTCPSSGSLCLYTQTGYNDNEFVGAPCHNVPALSSPIIDSVRSARNRTGYPVYMYTAYNYSGYSYTIPPNYSMSPTPNKNIESLSWGGC